MARSTLTEQISEVGGESGAIKEIVSFLSTNNVVYGILAAKNTLVNHGYRLVHTLDGVA